MVKLLTVLTKPSESQTTWLISPTRVLVPVTVTAPEVLVMVKVLEKLVKKPSRSAVKFPDSVKVPGKGPAAVPLTEKLKLPPSPLQAPLNVDPLTC